MFIKRKNKEYIKYKTNKNRNKILISIIILFLVVLAIRLTLSFQTQSLNKESYYHLDQAEKILETGKAELHNSLYDNSALPITTYLLAFFGMFLNLEVAAKILINLFIALSVVVIYFIALEISKDSKISFFVALFSGFIPLLFKEYINNFGSNGISIFVFLITLLFFIKSMHETKFIRHFIIALIVLIIMTPLSAVFIASFLIYFILLNAEKMRIRSSELEIFLFSLILGGWIYIILYKNIILEKGLRFLSSPILQNSIPLNNSLILGLIGIVPVLLGIVGIYFNTIKKPNRQILFITSFIIVNLIFILIGLVNVEYVLVMISLGLVICSATALKEITEFFNKSKVKRVYNILLVITFILFFLSSIVPSLTNALVSTHEVPSLEDKEALITLKENSHPNSIVMSYFEDSYLVEYFSNRKTVISFNGIDNNKRLEDIQHFFNINLNTEALRTLTLYGADYIFISNKKIKDMTKKSLEKFGDNCYGKLYMNKSRLYKVLCTLKQEEELNEELFEDKNGQ